MYAMQAMALKQSSDHYYPLQRKTLPKQMESREFQRVKRLMRA